MLEFKEIPFGSAAYENTIALRYEVLRKPLGLVFDPVVLAREIYDNHLCAYSDSQLVACLIMSPQHGKTVKMRQFAVDASFQRQGIGKALVAFAEEWAAGQGFNHIELHARRNAVPFYLKLEYKTKGEEFIEVTIPHFFMEKTLAGFTQSSQKENRKASKEIS